MLSGWISKKPHGIVEDVLVRIEGCYFPIDFLVVDIKITKELSQAPIILGRPLLATSKADETRPRGRRFHTVSCQK